MTRHDPGFRVSSGTQSSADSSRSSATVTPSTVDKPVKSVAATDTPPAVPPKSPPPPPPTRFRSEDHGRPPKRWPDIKEAPGSSSASAAKSSPSIPSAAAARNPPPAASASSNVSRLREPQRRLSDLHNYRRDLAALDTSAGRPPQIQHTPPSATLSISSQIAPWMAPPDGTCSNRSGGAAAAGGNNGGGAGNGEAPAGTNAGPVHTSFYHDDSDMSAAASPNSPAFLAGAAAGPASSSQLSSRSNQHQQQQQQQQQPSHGPADYSEIAPFDDGRRPSLASITTASSQGSKSSVRRGGMQKLQGFFGEEFPGRDSSETSLHSSSQGKDRSQSYSHSRPSRERNYSNATDQTRDASPSSSRPRTPVPAPEVVPFLYQNSDDIAMFGEAPVGESMTGSERQRFDASNNPQGPPKTSSSGRSGHSGGNVTGHHHHHHHPHPHRHNRSIDDGRSLKPTPSREESQAISQAHAARERGASAATAMYGSSKHRGHSPAPSVPSNESYFPPTKQGTADGPSSPTHHPKKRILDRFRRHKDYKDDDAGSGSGTSRRGLPSMPSSTRSLAPKTSRSDFQKGGDHARTPAPAPSTFPINWPPNNDQAGAQDAQRSHQLRAATFNNKFPFSKKARSQRPPDSLDEQIGPTDRNDGRQGTMFHLDTDLNDMEGILTKPPPLTPLDNGVVPQAEPERPDQQEQGPGKAEAGTGPATNGAWNAPDSWAVRRNTEDDTYQVPEVDDVGSPPRPEEMNVTYCIRIFKTDNTFSTLAMPLQASVADVISQIIKKSYSAEGPENFQVTMHKHDLIRVLSPAERPLLIQKRLLQMVGYEEKDRIEEVGREDNSYICRFVFLSNKEGDFHSQSKIEPNFSRIAKFNYVDLSRKNLVTVPIALYSKASEIMSLNLSRNLSIDLPRDFIQSCVNLRDIQFSNNELRRLPPSLGKATKLTYLDLSNNRLQDLETGGLQALSRILKINLANNRLTRLPSYFGSFQSLRNINISSNFLEKFPPFLCELESLVELDLSFNGISEFPEEIGNMKSLEKLVITNNRLTGKLKGSFSGLSMLRELDIKYNNIESLDIISTLPRLEVLYADHNLIGRFMGRFEMIRSLKLNSNPIAVFEVVAPTPTLKMLNLSTCQLASIDESFHNLMSLESLYLDRNYFVSLPAHIGNLGRLEHFTIANNSLGELPPTIGCLTELRSLDIRGNNIKKLPMEIWWANKLESLNASSNVLDSFPRPASRAPRVGGDDPQQQQQQQQQLPVTVENRPTPSNLSQASGSDDSDASRRPSQVSSSTLLSVGPSPVPPGPDRKSSVVSVYGKGGRKTSVVSRSTAQQGKDGATTSQTPPPPPPPPPPPASSTTSNPSQSSRKDSGLSSRLTNTFAGSLKHLALADNQIDDDSFEQLILLNELRVLNLSYNEFSDIPQRAIKNWPQLVELYLSGNELTQLPADDLEDSSLLQVLHINSNKFTNLPADISRAKKLQIFDCGCNALKYNICNVPYDWNWNLNPQLRYLNLSGNKRLEIKQNGLIMGPGAATRESLADFTRLANLRLLGLMDVTLPSPNIPEQNEDRRIRTSGSLAGHLPYGMADTLGKNEHLSTMDLVVPRFNASETETLLGLFDGQKQSSGGSKIAKYLHENFGHILTEELKNLKTRLDETPVDALRRAFLTLNKDLITTANQNIADRSHKVLKGQAPPVVLSKEDLNYGGVATVVYLQALELYVANVGDSQAMLIQQDGTHKFVTRKHDPAEPSERSRIREAGGWVSRNGRTNDLLGVSRAFGYEKLMPSVMAAPYISNVTVQENDDLLLIASGELWEYMSPGLVVDMVRSERKDLMRSAQKLRDMAIAYGCNSKIMVMLLSMSDLKRRVERSRLHRGQSMSLYPSGVPEDFSSLPRRGKKTKGDILDHRLKHLEAEIPAPIGSVAIVFTDIKNSTNLWEMYPTAMRSAIKLHNDLMRRQLRHIGGYEVKTEGDAFMVSFPTATSALLWCFAVQMQLLDVEWPSDILNSVSCQPVYDKDQTLIFKGLSVRMGIHFGEAVNEMDPVTRRMDYFGPMVNKASRISAVADGGQITVSSDFISEVQRCLETSQDVDRNGSTGSDDALDDDSFAAAIRRDLRSLTSQGFEVKEMGERKLKGLENPEVVYSLYPHALNGRSETHQRHDRGIETTDKPAMMQTGGDFGFDTDLVWRLESISLRLEKLCTALETESAWEGPQAQAPESDLLEWMKRCGGEVTEPFLMNLIGHQIARVESSTTTLALRHMANGKSAIGHLEDLSGPIAGVLGEVTRQMVELQKYRAMFGSLPDGGAEDDGEEIRQSKITEI